MNTRGLTELIVLNLALEKGVISDALFAMLVIMALVTTRDHRARAEGRSTRATSWAPRSRRSSRRLEPLSMADFPALPLLEQSVLVAPEGDAALGSCCRWPARWRARSLRAS